MSERKLLEAIKRELVKMLRKQLEERETNDEEINDEKVQRKIIDAVEAYWDKVVMRRLSEAFYIEEIKFGSSPELAVEDVINDMTEKVKGYLGEETFRKIGEGKVIQMIVDAITQSPNFESTIKILWESMVDSFYDDYAGYDYRDKVRYFYNLFYKHWKDALDEQRWEEEERLGLIGFVW